MGIRVETSEIEWYILPAFSVYNLNWGGKPMKLGINVYWLKYCVMIG